MSTLSTVRKQLALPIEKHPTLERVRLRSRRWVSTEIDLFTYTMKPPANIDYHETSMVEPNRTLVSYLVTGVQLTVNPRETFIDWRARFVIDKHRVIVDEIICTSAYSNFDRIRRFERPLGLRAGNIINFFLTPDHVDETRATSSVSIKLDLIGYEITDEMWRMLSKRGVDCAL